MKRIVAILMVFALFMLCACSNETQPADTEKQTQPQTEAEKIVGATATNKDGSFAVTLDKYAYDADKDTINVTLDNNSDTYEYSCSEKVILEQFDETSGEFVSAGEDQVYDDLLYFLTAKTSDSFSFLLCDKFPDFAPTKTTKCRLGFVIEQNSGEKETIYVNVDIS